jgi:hypothetical protein
MFRRLLLSVLLFAAASNVRALEYTDVYYIPEESGWGIFLIQSDTFQFLSFFIYGPDGNPLWYTAELSDNGSGSYTGPLYATTGTYFADPWDPAKLTATVVGTASFTPVDLYHATLAYGLTGGPTVTKSVRRQTLLPYVLAGKYSGSAAGTISSCNDPADNDPAQRYRYNVEVTQVNDDSATLVFSFVDTAHAGQVCTVSGALTHLGRLYRMADAQGSCTGPGSTPGNFPVVVESFHPTGQGIEARTIAQLGGGCVQVLHLAAVHL